MKNFIIHSSFSLAEKMIGKWKVREGFHKKNRGIFQLPRIWIYEVEYVLTCSNQTSEYQKVSSNVHNIPQGTEKQLSKVKVVVGGGWWL